MLHAEQKLSKEERLKSRKRISELFEDGQVVYGHPFKALFKLKNKEEQKFPVQIAISVSKKNFKFAVNRNQIKRKVRESYRRNKHLLYKNLEKSDQNLTIFVIYTAKNDLEFATIEEFMILFLKKLVNKLHLS